MRRAAFLLAWIFARVGATPLAAQEAGGDGGEPWLLRVLVFLVSLPYTLYLVFVEGGRMHLLPAPLLGAALCIWSFREWRRQRYWTPRVVHLMAILGLVTIILINVDWVMAGGEMWTQRYVVIAVFGLFPYVAYLLFLGPKYIGRRRAPASGATLAEELQAFEPPPDRPRDSGALVGFYAAVGVLAIVGIGAAGVILSSGAFRAASVSRPELAGLRAPESLVPMARGVRVGDPEARITIMEFGDYQCPACGAYALRFKPRVDSALVATGGAQFVFFDLPLVSLHPNAFLAARASHCAEDQDRYWEYHDELFRQQEAWAPMAAPLDAFVRYAEAMGADPVEFRSCLESDRHADLVEANTELADAFRISSTPTIIVSVEGGDTRVVHRYGFDTVVRAIEEATADPTAR